MIDGQKRSLAIIPARLGSTRLPRKILRTLPANPDPQSLCAGPEGQGVWPGSHRSGRRGRPWSTCVVGATAVATSTNHISRNRPLCRSCCSISWIWAGHQYSGRWTFVDPGHLDMLCTFDCQRGVSLATLICPLAHPDDFTTKYGQGGDWPHGQSFVFQPCRYSINAPG